MKGIVYGHLDFVLIGEVVLVSIPGSWTWRVHGDHSDEGRRTTAGTIWRRTGDREFF